MNKSLNNEAVKRIWDSRTYRMQLIKILVSDNNMEKRKKVVELLNDTNILLEDAINGRDENTILIQKIEAFLYPNKENSNNKIFSI